MTYFENKLRHKILSNAINILIISIADEYLMKLKKDEKNPPKLIEEYLNKSVYLTEKKIKIKKINNKLSIMEKELKVEFDKVINENEEYRKLISKLNFTFNLIRDQELQNKYLDKIYEQFIEFEKSYEPKKQTEKMFNSNWILKKNYKLSYLTA